MDTQNIDDLTKNKIEAITIATTLVTMLIIMAVYVTTTDTLTQCITTIAMLIMVGLCDWIIYTIMRLDNALQTTLISVGHTSLWVMIVIAAIYINGTHGTINLRKII